MELPAGQVWVGTLERRVCIRVQGRATHLHGPPLRDFAKEMLRRGHVEFELDLGACSYMDSTFLGVLASLSARLEQAGAGPLAIYRINARNLELFKTLGIDRLFEMRSPRAAASEQLPETLEPLAAAAGGGAEWAGTVLEAHQFLTEADERNEPRFKDLLDYLREDLARPRPAPAGSPEKAARRWKQ